MSTSDGKQMKIRTNHRATKTIIAATTISLMLTTFGLTEHSYAANNDNVSLSYAVYIGSTRMFKIAYNLELSPTSYKVAMRLKSKGLAKFFVNISMLMRANGRFKKAKILPLYFSNYQKKKRRKRTAKINWNGKAQPTTSRTWKIGSAKRNSLNKSVKASIPDPLSAFLRIGITSAEKPCVGTQRIYDGSTVYDLSFKMLQQTQLSAQGSSSYKGPAYKCQIKHTPIAGFSKKRFAKALAKPAIFNVWFAPVTSKVAGKTILIPVAATGTVKGRSFSAYTRRSLYNGKPM